MALISLSNAKHTVHSSGGHIIGVYILLVQICSKSCIVFSHVTIVCLVASDWPLSKALLSLRMPQ
jgi:hypothetical protein